MTPPPEISEAAGGRPVVVLLTVHWHQRSSLELAVGLGATVFAPAANIGDVGAPALPYGLGDALPGGVEPQPGGYPEEMTLWTRPTGRSSRATSFSAGRRDSGSNQTPGSRMA
jgi:hypothetical protein